MLASLGSRIIVCWVFGRVVDKLYLVKIQFEVSYEARTLLGLGVSRCQTRVVSDTDTCNYTELCNFFKLLVVLACRCPCRVRIRAS